MRVVPVFARTILQCSTPPFLDPYPSIYTHYGLNIVTGDPEIASFDILLFSTTLDKYLLRILITSNDFAWEFCFARELLENWPSYVVCVIRCLISLWSMCVYVSLTWRSCLLLSVSMYVHIDYIIHLLLTHLSEHVCNRTWKPLIIFYFNEDGVRLIGAFWSKFKNTIRIYSIFIHIKVKMLLGLRNR